MAAHLSVEAEPQTMTSRLENLLGPNLGRSFDAMYEQQREPRYQLYSKQLDCHMLLPKAQMSAVLKRWMTVSPNDGNNL